MPPPYFLLALPSEIRNEIWRHLLCPHGGVNLLLDSDDAESDD